MTNHTCACEQKLFEIENRTMVGIRLSLHTFRRSWHSKGLIGYFADSVISTKRIVRAQIQEIFAPKTPKCFETTVCIVDKCL